MMRKLCSCGVLALAITLSAPAWSDDSRATTDMPTKEELILALKPAEGPITRGIKPVDRTEQASTSSTAGTADIYVFFEHNSSVLTPEATEVLAIVAEALQSQELSPYQFLIEGHTDASGSDDYNLFLSDRRAHAVVNHLTSRFTISPRQMSSVGKGESDLLIEDDPFDSRNRRVRIRNLGAS